MSSIQPHVAKGAGHVGSRNIAGLAILLGALGTSVAVWAVLVLCAFLLIG